MKRGWMLLAVVAVFGFSGVANAVPLEVIGTATYLNNVYNLIYEPAQGLVWLDYTHGVATWQSQLDWAAGLNGPGVLTYSLYPEISVYRVGVWRLPSVGVDPQQGAGQNTSEMGHLYYDSLHKMAWGPLGDTHPFENLQTDHSYYWTGSEVSDPFGSPFDAWTFGFWDGTQWWESKGGRFFAMAVLPGDVVSGPVPEPATMLLLGSGLIGLAGYGRKKFFKK